MYRDCELMAEWVVDALRTLGGKASILDICKQVWNAHGAEIQAAGDLFYEWQYEVRWAGDLLRKSGKLKPASTGDRGIWELAE
jgi:hypothetical protein